ncbi:MAG: YicC/YloC family endoribonuclease [Thermodesulfobacteriota bacterium]
MTNSMTGYGNSRFNLNGMDCLIEVRSINHRYLDIKLKTSDVFFSFESKIRKEIEKIFFRGTFDVYIRVLREKGIDIDESFASEYLAALRDLKEKLGLDGEINLDFLFRFKDQFKHRREPLSEGHWETVKEGLEEALKNLAEMRRAEGAALTKDIISRLEMLQCYLDDIDKKCPVAQREYLARLEERLNNLLKDKENLVDDARMLKEMAHLTEKSDITEEIVRFNVHIEQFKNVLKEKKSVGRKMDFLCQEMGREVNTIGAKTINAAISSLVIELKSEVERIRAQVQNIE